MKRLVYAVLALAVMTGSAVYAHDEGKAEKKDEGKRHERMATMMKDKLGLTDEQSKKLEALHKSGKETIKPLHEALEKAVNRVHGQLLLDASDSEISSSLEQVKKAHEALEDAMKKMKAEADAILTPKQRAKMLVFRAEMMHRRMGMGMMHRGGGPEDGRGGAWGQGGEEHGGGGGRGERREKKMIVEEDGGAPDEGAGPEQIDDNDD